MHQDRPPATARALALGRTGRDRHCVARYCLISNLVGDSPERLRGRAEAAARAGDWVTALNLWRTVNSTKAATGLTHLGEARACLALGRARQAEQSLRRSIAADPADPEPWRLLLEILRVEDRTLEALRMGWEAFDQARPESRRVLLSELTLSLLADLPDERMRTTLRRWIDADADDVDARIALLQRIAAQPRAADPDRASVLAELESILARPSRSHRRTGGAGDRPGRRRRAQSRTRPAE